jgi:predicted  nucleic acid-binding Zn-ribbon protein
MRGRMGGMPSAHRVALKKLLEHVSQRIAQDEAKLLKITGDDEREKLIEEIADLHVRRNDLMDALGGDGDSN